MSAGTAFEGDEWKGQQRGRRVVQRHPTRVEGGQCSRCGLHGLNVFGYHPCPGSWRGVVRPIRGMRTRCSGCGRFGFELPSLCPWCRRFDLPSRASLRTARVRVRR